MAALSRALRLDARLITPCRSVHRLSLPTTPGVHRLHGPLGTPGLGSLPRSLAATEGVAVAFSSSRYLDVSVPWVCFPALYIQTGMTRYDPRRVAPFGNPRINAWYAAPRGLSQLPHVLHRRFMPRHPPASLSSLGMSLTITCHDAFEKSLDSEPMKIRRS